MVRLQPFLSVLGLPCQSPPWGYVTAVDLRTMKKVWMHKNGTSRDSAPLGLPFPVGTPALAGPLRHIGHRRRLAAGWQAPFPQLLTGLQVISAQVVIQRTAHEGHAAGGDDRPAKCWGCLLYTSPSPRDS